jgi:hypothetical protein
VAADREHVRTFGRLTQVRGQRVCERGEHKSGAIDRWPGESAVAGFEVFDEAPTSQVFLALGTSGGKPTEADKTSFALESPSLVP